MALSRTMPSVSVIVPNYNHAPYLPRRIESILAQTHGDFELLILDDRSPDDSREVIQRYADDSRVRILFNERNSGNSYLQWRKGIQLTTGAYIWIAESDDFADTPLLERLAAKLDEDPQVGLAFCETNLVDQDDSQLGWYFDQSRDAAVYSNECREALKSEFVLDGRDYIRRFMLPWNTIPNASGVLFRRSALESVGGPETSMRLCGDWLTYCKILSKWKIGHVPERLNFFRQHRVNVRSNIRGETFAREWLQVAAWVERELGSLPGSTRWQLDRAAADALLLVEQRLSDNRVPFRRMPAALARAAKLAPRLLRPTALTLLRQSVGSFSRVFRSS